MSSLNDELSGDRRNPGTFQSEEEFHNWRRRNNLGFRPVLRLRPPPPPPPQRPAMPPRMTFGGAQFPVSVPEADPNHVWVTNRDSLEGNWHSVNSPITEQAVGPTTFRQIGEDQTFQPQHHGINVAAESRMSDDQLRQNLENWNLPTEGNRDELFARNMRVKHHPTFMRNFAEGRAANEAEVSDIANPNQPIDLREAARLRGLRQEAGYYENVPEVRPRAPMPQSNMRTLADLARPAEGAARVGGAAGEAAAVEGAGAAAAGAGEMGAMGSAAMMAGRAVPILNMVLLGKMLMDSATSQSKENKAKQQQLMYRT